MVKEQSAHFDQRSRPSFPQLYEQLRLHAVATLACWSLLHVNLAGLLGRNVQIVIASSEVKYSRPVTINFQAECSMPDTLDWEYFVKILQKKGRARLKLDFCATGRNTRLSHKQ